MSTVCNQAATDAPILESVSRLARQAASLAKRNDADESYGPELWEAVKSMGLSALMIPEEFGGAGASVRLFCEVVELLAGTDATTATLVHLQGNNAYLIRFAPDKGVSEPLLAEIAEKSLISAYALTEPSAGSDAAQIQATARPDGNGYRLNGTKCFSSWASLADIVLVFARITT